MWNHSLLLILILNVVLVSVFIGVGLVATSSKDKKVVIVGGGAAGISALSRLLENGYQNVILLEAQDKIGGRIATVPFASNKVDLGAQWCHGYNIIYEMVYEHNVLGKTPESYFEGQLISSQGETKSDYEDLFELTSYLAESSERLIRRFRGSMGDFYTQQLVGD
jgi:spermine oxidase